METQIEQKTFYKSKKFVIPAAIIGIMLVSLVAAAVIYHQVTVDVTVNEALSTVTTTMSVSSYPGETQAQTLTIDNAANTQLNTSITWSEDSNPALVSYITNMPQIVTLAPGSNDINLTWTIDPDSPVGVFNGSITLTRIA